jgi:hypothetical protein
VKIAATNYVDTTILQSLALQYGTGNYQNVNVSLVYEVNGNVSYATSYPLAGISSLPT